MAAKNTHVKKAGLDDDLTPQQAKELVRCTNDPHYFFSNYVKVQHPALGAVLFNPRDYQTRVLNGVIDNDQSIILQPRQSGKSTIIVAYLLWRTIFEEDIKVGIASHIGDGAKDLMTRFKYAYEELPVWMKPGVKEYNVFNVTFDNNSSIEAATTTEKTFRGRSLSIIYLDELAFVIPRVADKFWTSLRPALSAGAGTGKSVKLIATSTPNGSEGLFASLWHKSEMGENDFFPVRVYNEEVPGRDEAFKQDMLKDMSLTQYRQEYGCEFLSDKGTLIASEVLEALRPKEPIATHQGMNIYAPVRSKRLGIAVDVGTGVGQDYSVVQVFDIDSLEQVAQYRDNRSTITEISIKIIKILEFLVKQGAEEIFYTVESNMGMGVINLLEHSENPVLDDERITFVSEKRKIRGIYTTNKSKLSGCTKLKDLTEAGRLKMHSRELLSELKFFVKSGASFKAESGMHDDIVMSTVLMMNMLQIVAKMDDDVSDNMTTLYNFSIGDEGEGDDFDPLPVCF